MNGWKRGFVLVVALLASRVAHADDVDTRVVGDSSVLMMKETSGWTKLCVAPCAITLQRGAIFKIGGDSIRESKPFVFVPSHDRILMEIDVARRTPRTAGLVVGLVGTTLAVVGAGFLFASSVDDAYLHNTAGEVIGGAALGVGVVSAIVGFAFFVANARSEVHLRAF